MPAPFKEVGTQVYPPKHDYYITIETILTQKNRPATHIEKKSHGGYQLLDFGHDLEHIFSHFEEMSNKYLA